MMETAGPINGNVGLTISKLAGGIKGGACIERAIMIETIKYRTVVAGVVGVCIGFWVPRVVRRSNPRICSVSHKDAKRKGYAKYLCKNSI